MSKLYVTKSMSNVPTKLLSSAKESTSYKLLDYLEHLADEVLSYAWMFESYKIYDVLETDSFVKSVLIEFEVTDKVGNLLKEVIALPDKISFRVPVAHRSDLSYRFKDSYKYMKGVIHNYPVTAEDGIETLLPVGVKYEYIRSVATKRESGMTFSRLINLLRPSKYWRANGDLILSESPSSELDYSVGSPSTQLEMAMSDLFELYLSPTAKIVNESMSSEERVVLEYFSSAQSLITKVTDLADSHGGMFEVVINDDSLIGPGTTMGDLTDNEHANLLIDVLLTSEEYVLMTIEMVRVNGEKVYKFTSAGNNSLQFTTEFEIMKMVGNVLRDIYQVESMDLEELEVDNVEESNSLPTEFDEIELDTDLIDQGLMASEVDSSNVQRFQEDLEDVVDSESMSDEDLKSSLIDRIKSRRN